MLSRKLAEKEKKPRKNLLVDVKLQNASIFKHEKISKRISAGKSESFCIENEYV
jgi:hypothetical protein